MKHDFASHRLTSVEEFEAWIQAWIDSKDEMLFLEGILKLPQPCGKSKPPMNNIFNKSFNPFHSKIKSFLNYKTDGNNYDNGNNCNMANR